MLSGAKRTLAQGRIVTLFKDPRDNSVRSSTLLAPSSGCLGPRHGAIARALGPVANLCVSKGALFIAKSNQTRGLAGFLESRWAGVFFPKSKTEKGTRRRRCVPRDGLRIDCGVGLCSGVGLR